MDEKKRKFVKAHFWGGLFHILFLSAVLAVGYICQKYWGISFDLILASILCLITISWWILIGFRYYSFNFETRILFIGLGVFFTAITLLFSRKVFFGQGYTIVHLAVLLIVYFFPAWIYKRKKK